jgi:hypothetical protein
LRTWPAFLAALVIGLSVSACARPVDDFGRAEADPVHDGAATAIRAWRDLKQPASVFNLTDEEQEMRDRVWRYLVAPQAYDWFGDSLAELTRIGFVPVRFKAAPRDRYYLWLHGTTFASSKTRYSRLGDDIQADLGTMQATFASICRVEGIDRQRGIAANGITGLEDKMLKGAAAQQTENRAVIGWFAAALASRYDTYSYALDHLLVETPHPDAVAVDTKLSQLEVDVEAAGSDQYCEPSRGAPMQGRQATIGSRYLRPVAPKAGS